MSESNQKFRREPKKELRNQGCETQNVILNMASGNHQTSSPTNLPVPRPPSQSGVIHDIDLLETFQSPFERASSPVWNARIRSQSLQTASTLGPSENGIPRAGLAVPPPEFSDWDSDEEEETEAPNPLRGLTFNSLWPRPFHEDDYGSLFSAQVHRGTSKSFMWSAAEAEQRPDRESSIPVAQPDPPLPGTEDSPAETETQLIQYGRGHAFDRDPMLQGFSGLARLTPFPCPFPPDSSGDVAWSDGVVETIHRLTMHNSTNSPIYPVEPAIGPTSLGRTELWNGGQPESTREDIGDGAFRLIFFGGRINELKSRPRAAKAAAEALSRLARLENAILEGVIEIDESLSDLEDGLVDLPDKADGIAALKRTLEFCQEASSGLRANVMMLSMRSRAFSELVDIKSIRIPPKQDWIRMWMDQKKIPTYATSNLDAHCPICLDKQCSIHLDCGHNFCGDCVFTCLYDRLMESGKAESSCPLCRAPFAPQGITPLPVQHKGAKILVQDLD